MSPTEERLWRMAMTEAVAAAVKPLRDELEAHKKATEKQLRNFENGLRRHSDGIQKVGSELPRMQSQHGEEREEDMRVVADSLEKMRHLFDDLADQVGHLDKTIKERELVGIEAEKAKMMKATTLGGQQVVIPASVVAAESSVRTETKTDALTIKANDAETKIKKIGDWQKFLAVAVVSVPIVAEGIRELYHAITGH